MLGTLISFCLSHFRWHWVAKQMYFQVEYGFKTTISKHHYFEISTLTEIS